MLRGTRSLPWFGQITQLRFDAPLAQNSKPFGIIGNGGHLRDLFHRAEAADSFAE